MQLRLQRGDTIIEVLLAFTVFSLVSVGTMTIMGQGTNASQRALEITLVRQQIDAQAEALRAAQQSYTRNDDPNSAWNSIALGSSGDSTHFVSSDETPCPISSQMNNGASNVFIMNPHTATATTTGNWYSDINSAGAPPYAQLESETGPSYGIWIEREFNSGDGTVPDSYDFDVRACWFGAGLNVPMQIETSVRLYEP